MTERPSQIAQIIWSARKAKKITQQKLAEAVGVQQQTVALWENGAIPKAMLVSKIEQALDVQLWDTIRAAAGQTVVPPPIAAEVPTLTEYWRSRYLSAARDNARLREEVDSLTRMAEKLLAAQEAQEGKA